MRSAAWGDHGTFRKHHRNLDQDRYNGAVREMRLEPVPRPQPDLFDVALPSLDAVPPGSRLATFAWESREAAVLTELGSDPLDDSLQIARWRLYRGDLDDALDAARRVVRRSVVASSWTKTVLGKHLEVQIQLMRGQFEEAQTAAHGIEGIAALDVDSSASLYAREVQGMLLFFSRSTAQEDIETITIFESLVADYIAKGMIHDSLRVCERAARACAAGEQYLQAINHCEQGLRRAAEHEEYAYVGRLLIAAASAMADVGYREHVEEIFQLGRRWTDYTGDRMGSAIGLLGLSQYYGYAMDPSALDEVEWRIAPAIEARRECEAMGAYPLASQACDSMAFVYRKIGDVDRAEEASRQAAYINTPIEDIAHQFRWQETRIFRTIDQVRMDRMAARVFAGMESSPDLYFIFDPVRARTGELIDLRNEFRNSAAGRLLGVHSSSVRMLSEIHDHPYFESLAPYIRNAVIDRQPYHDMLQHHSEEGNVWLTRSVLPSDNGALVIFRDITESRLIAEKLRIEADEARHAAEVKMRFLSHMSHEVRTPLNGILGLAQSLGEAPLTPGQASDVAAIVASGRQLLDFFNDVIELSRIESGVRPQVLEPTAATALAQHVFADAGLEADIEALGDVPPSVVMERSAFLFVLERVAHLLDPDRRIKIQVEGDGKTMHVRVGPISEAYENTLIDEAIKGRLDSPNVASVTGRWVGLYAASRLCAELGEPLTVEATQDGQRFACFRLAYRRSAPQEPTGGDTDRSLKGCRILMAEDNPVNVVVTRRMLEKLGCEVTVVGDGTEALKALEESEFDLVLMDVRMPKMDGLDATRAIRAKEATSGRHMIIVALTAASFTDERQECRDSGMDGYVAKPFTRQALVDELVRWYPLRAS